MSNRLRCHCVGETMRSTWLKGSVWVWCVSLAERVVLVAASAEELEEE
jgi:hypothetical protein